jgi:hypothetical protein
MMRNNRMGPARLSLEYRPGPSVNVRFTKKCAICKEPTRESKDYCPDHIMNVEGYALLVSDKDDEARREVNEVEEKGAEAVNPEGLVCDEILGAIAEAGKVTYRRLIKDWVLYLYNRESHIAESFLERLIAEGLVTTMPLPRGQKMAVLTEKGWDTAGAQRAIVG